jgi:hypothetical protein
MKPSGHFLSISILFFGKKEKFQIHDIHVRSLLIEKCSK